MIEAEATVRAADPRRSTAVVLRLEMLPGTRTSALSPSSSNPARLNRACDRVAWPVAAPQAMPALHLACAVSSPRPRPSGPTSVALTARRFGS
ncbi:hypothetical protein ACFQFC_22160 [Amorphoplanes digitatis]|uniref:hypothetical protein n=1 Tax=Actinoplanes digitatis TaxID=1868 RepID=UPI003607CC50|nr:hypothetical protein GCM10020092_104560 [Actinoplanes digitatis]